MKTTSKMKTIQNKHGLNNKDEVKNEDNSQNGDIVGCIVYLNIFWTGTPQLTPNWKCYPLFKPEIQFEVIKVMKEMFRKDNFLGKA